MSRVYKSSPVEVHTEELGWSTPEAAKGLKRLQVSLEYTDNNGYTGTEDFSIERLKTLSQSYIVELKTFKQSKGQRLTTDKLIPVKDFFYGKRSDVIAMITNAYSKFIDKGYSVVTTKFM